MTLVRCGLAALLSVAVLTGPIPAQLASAGPAATEVHPTDKAAPSAAAAATVTRKTLRRAIRQLQVADEHRRGYDRDKFRHWIDADRDCQDTRDEVLQAESRVRVRGCDITRGRWYSYYDGRTWRRSSSVDIDHLVALAEAWDSGAWRWTAGTRTRYANDLGYRGSLVAVTDNVNQSKSDQDPSDWLPPRKAARCRYITEWVTVKSRWQLRANPTEKRDLRNAAGQRCLDKTITIRPARVRLRSTPDPDPAPSGVGITKIHYNPDGDESVRPNGEYVVIKNHTSRARSLQGWSLSDDTTVTYAFGSFTLNAGATVKVRSGNGSDTNRTVYAGWGARWNNDGDTATVYNRSGTVKDRCSYPGGGVYVNC